MRRQLGTKHPLHQPCLKFFHQPGITKQILRPLAAPQKFVQQFLGNRHRPCSSQEAWTKAQLHRRSDTLIWFVDHAVPMGVFRVLPNGA